MLPGIRPCEMQMLLSGATAVGNLPVCQKQFGLSSDTIFPRNETDLSCYSATSDW